MMCAKCPGGQEQRGQGACTLFPLPLQVQGRAVSLYQAVNVSGQTSDFHFTDCFSLISSFLKSAGTAVLSTLFQDILVYEVFYSFLTLWHLMSD